MEGKEGGTRLNDVNAEDLLLRSAEQKENGHLQGYRS